MSAVEFLRTCLKKIKDNVSRKFADVKKPCDAVIEFLDQLESQKIPLAPYTAPIPIKVPGAGDGASDDVKAGWDAFAHFIFNPLRQACETKERRVVEGALDALEKILDLGVIQGFTDDREAAGQKLISSVVKAVEICFEVSQKDEGIQLQILKVFTTAVNSTVCGVHESNLMTAVRICYNIYLISGEQNRKTAKTTLTSMLNLLFTRFQDAPQSAPSQPGATTEDDDDAEPSGTKTPTETRKRPSVDDAPTDDSKPSEDTLTVDDVDQSEGISRPVTPGPANDPNSSSAPATTTAATPAPAKAISPAEQAYRDCFQTFRGLCKLSMKKIPPNVSNMDSIEVRSKILSLELILSIFDTNTHVFKDHTRFINNALKKNLVMSIMLNGTSSISLVYRTTLAIFVFLVRDFRYHFKHEVEVFFRTIILPGLESNTSSLQQKLITIRDLYTICKSPQALVDLFVNYDCDPAGKDIYEDMVKSISKIAQKKMSEATMWGNENLEEELALKVMALKTIVTITKSLADWSQELYEPPVDLATIQQKTQGMPAAAEDGNVTEESLAPPTRTREPDVYEAQKQLKVQLDKGKELFKLSCKKGMEFFHEHGMVERNPEDIAKFLRNTPGLDKAKIGEYLGEPKPFFVSVMHAYVDLFSFPGMEIDLALREFLSYFRLPGEGQKIDRLMEKFAERFFKDNSGGMYGNADAAYLLAFSIIMLATDLHNPAQKNKMQRSDWKRLLLGQNDGKDYDDLKLDAIYARIAAEELKVRDDDVSGTTPEKPDPQLVVEKQLNMLKDRSALKGNSTVFHKATNVEYAKPMFGVSWHPILAALSVIMEENDADEKLVAMCLEGWKLGIRLSCIFYMDIERRAYIGALAGFTLLENLREMRIKNIECIDTLLQLALTDGNYLRDSWRQVLKIVSLLERMYLLGTGQKVNDALPDGSNQGTPTRRTGPNYEVTNAQSVAAAIPSVAIDRIFTNSVGLSSFAILDFVKSLCAVSQEELVQTVPRIFCLQKLVEIADYNMYRVRMVWSKIWRELAQHFTLAALLKNQHVALYAVDSLRQLAIKFLEKDELSTFHFQKEFMQPFGLVFENENKQIREMVIHCIAQMIKTRAANIKSGWDTLLQIFQKAAYDIPEIAELAFDQLLEVKKEYFELISENYFKEFVQAVVAYGFEVRSSDKVAPQAIAILKFCAGKLADGSIAIDDIAGAETDEGEAVPAGKKFSDCPQHEAYWFPIFDGLRKIVVEADINIRPLALDALTKTFTAYGNLFTPALLKKAFTKFLLGIFVPIVEQANEGKYMEESEWILTTCLKALHATITVYSTFFEDIGQLLPDILQLLQSLVLQDNETIATFGVTCFDQLMTSCSPKFDSVLYGHVCATANHILRKTTPEKHILAVYTKKQKKPRRSSKEKKDANSSSEPISPSEAGSNGTTTDQKQPSPRKSLDAPDITKPTTAKHGRSHSAKVPEEDLPKTPTKLVTNANGGSIAKSSSSSDLVAKRQATSPAKNPEATLVRSDSGTNQRARVLDPREIKKRIIIGKLRIQGQFILSVQEKLLGELFSQLGMDQSVAVLDALHGSLEAASSLLRNTELEAFDQNVLDLLLKQQSESFAAYFDALYLTFQGTNEEKAGLSEKRIVSHIREFIADHLSRCNPPGPLGGVAKRVHEASEPLVARLLTQLSIFPDSTTHLVELYEDFVELSLSDSLPVRRALKDTLSRVGKLTITTATGSS